MDLWASRHWDFAVKVHSHRSGAERVTICNVFGHEPAIAEYVIVTKGLVDRGSAIWRWSPAWRGAGPPEWHPRLRTDRARGGAARRATEMPCAGRHRSPVADPAPADAVFPMAELDRMLPLCDTVFVSCGLVPETKGLIDAHRLALMKPGALLIKSRGR